MPLRKPALATLFFVAVASAWFLFEVSPAHLRQTVFLPAPASEEAPARPDGETAKKAPKSAPVAAKDVFGISRDRFTVSEARFRRGETLAGFLTDRGVPYETVLALVEEARPDFDVRQIRPGQQLRLYRGEDEAVRRIVYEKNRRDYLVFELGSGDVRVHAEQRTVEHARQAVRGVVDGSLYASLGRAGAPAALARKLVDLYAWQIDFFHLQKGDRFSVVYKERRIAGETVGVGDVLGAQIQHRGEDFFAYRFTQDGETGYFDAEGHSLRKSLLKAPLKYQRISSGYSESRMHPILNRRRPHRGVDYAAPRGTPVRSVGDGRVLRAEHAGGAGHYVKVRHSRTYTTGYMHLAKFASGVEPGATVEQGQVIGYVGSTGLSTGPHLDYRFWKDGVPVDPTEEEMPSARTIGPAQQDAFRRVTHRLRPLLAPALTATPPGELSLESRPTQGRPVHQRSGDAATR